MYKDTLKLNRPIYVGMSILDLSKHLMYDFYYNQLKEQYSCCNLFYTDTDSFILHVETDDVYKDIKDNQSQYDTSNYNNQAVNLGDPTHGQDAATMQYVSNFATYLNNNKVNLTGGTIRTSKHGLF